MSRRNRTPGEASMADQPDREPRRRWAAAGSGVWLARLSVAGGLVGWGRRGPGSSAGQGLAGGHLGGHLGELAARGAGCPAQVGEGLLIVQAFAFHQGALG